MNKRKQTGAPRQLPTNEPSSMNQPAYLNLGTSNSKEFVIASGKALRSYQAVAARDTFSNFESNISVRDQFTRGNYEYFRPSEAMPQKPEDIIASCREAYRKVGLIRNVIDLMADFGVQGIQITHPNSRIQKFCRGWWKKIQGNKVSERFLNLLYREAIVLVKRTMGKITFKTEEQIKAMAAMPNEITLPSIDTPLEPDIEDDKIVTTRKKNIPLRYNFLNPLSVKVLGDELAQFVGRTMYALKVTQKLRTQVQNPKNAAEKSLVESLPVELRTAIQSGATEIPLDPRKVRSFYYKKDDWQTWSDPIIYSVLNDVMLLEKMKLADLAALDGAISQVRLWSLGDLEKGIVPTDTAIQRLADILMSNPGGGAFDLIWGPELKFTEYKTTVHQFLGKAKYEPVLEGIYSGLGIPPTLTGSANASGFTNNFISLKTLVQRLEYGRSVLREFWEYEFELMRQAMGFQRAPKLEFDRMVLTDEASEKALLIQLVDRDLISVETLIERFGESAEFEELKLRKEARARESGTFNPKLGPYPQQLNELAKIALGKGYMGPNHVGLELPMDGVDSKTPFDTQMEVMKMAKTAAPGGGSTSKPVGKSGSGRPKTSTDKGRRTMRKAKPVGASAEEMDFSTEFMTNLLWSKEIAQPKISELITPAILHQFGKASMRALSNEQAKQAEEIKFALLCNLDLFEEVTPELVHAILKEGATISPAYQTLYNSFYTQTTVNNKREPTVDEIRTIQATVYSLMNID